MYIHIGNTGMQKYHKCGILSCEINLYTLNTETIHNRNIKLIRSPNEYVLIKRNIAAHALMVHWSSNSAKRDSHFLKVDLCKQNLGVILGLRL